MLCFQLNYYGVSHMFCSVFSRVDLLGCVDLLGFGSGKICSVLSLLLAPPTGSDTCQRRSPLSVAVGGATSKKRTKASNNYKGVLDQSVTQPSRLSGGFRALLSTSEDV